MIALRVRQGQAGYGRIPQPTAEVHFISEVPTYRARRAALHRIAALVEEATPKGETWIVQTDAERLHVYLELATANEGENDRGLDMLDVVAKKVSRGGGIPGLQATTLAGGSA